MSPRSFAILALATAASVALAVSAISQREAPSRVAVTGSALFPDLLDHFNDIRTIRIATPEGTFTVNATDKGWSLAEKAGYPVEATQVRNLALAVANLQLVEAKTADPERLRRLELEDPGGDGSKSRLVEILGANGAAIAAAVVGKASSSVYGGGRGGAYVRRAGDNQAWLAAGELDLPSDGLDLLGREIIDLPLSQVSRVTLQPPKGSALTLARPDGKAEFATDAALPEGRKLDPVKVESLAGALAGFAMSDVRPASEMPAPPDAPRGRFETFDGLGVDITLIRQGEGDAAQTWVTLRPSVGTEAPAGEEGKEDEPADRAAKIAARTDGWVFQIPAYMADRLDDGVDQLLADPPSAS
jgi:hypothetical protein